MTSATLEPPAASKPAIKPDRLVDGIVLAAHDFELVRDTDIITMTKRN